MTPREALIDWMESVTNWTTKMDMTFKWNANEFIVKRHFTRWMSKNLPSTTYLYAIEQDPNQHKVGKTGQGLNQSCHIHAISDQNWDIILEKRGKMRKDFGRTGRTNSVFPESNLLKILPKPRAMP